VSDHYGKAAVGASLVHFLFGKALNAVVSLMTLVLLARWMPQEGYGVYIAFLALQSSLLALSNLGIDTTTERYMPEFRTRYADDKLLGFVSTALGARFVSLALLTLIVWFAAAPITTLVGVQAYLSEFRSWIAVVVATGALAFAVVVLEAMLHQRQAQICMSVYVVTKLVLLSFAHGFAELDLQALVYIELIATGLAAILALWQMIRRFPSTGFQSGWQVVLANRQRMQRFAAFNYIAQVLFQLFNAEVMKLLVTRLLGVLQAARYGFSQMLAETVQRYLPAVLLLRLIKPVFVSRYARNGDFSQLNAMARIILKLNLLVLVPIIAFAAVYGGQVLSALSDGKYGDAHWVFVGVLALLVPASHQLVLSLLAGTLEKNAMQLYAGLASTVAFPVALCLVPQWGPLGAVTASAISALIYNTFATIYLQRNGFPYRQDMRAIGIFGVAGIGLYAFAYAFSRLLEGWVGMALIVTFGVLSFFVFVRLLSAFSDDERDMMNSVLPRRIFIF
jgi:O-antigen/teichoic acid export membrane protein